MSRAYDARKVALGAYPDDEDKAVDLFLGYLDCDEDDFEYEFGQTAEKYLFEGES